jgi:membrane protease YdiL (CAAX protease family)
MKFLQRTWTTTWRIVVFIVLWAALSAPLIIPAIKKYVPPSGAPPLPIRLYIEIVCAVTILIAAWVVLRFIDRRSFVSLGFARRNLIRDSLIGLMTGLGMMAVGVAFLYVFGWLRWDATTAFSGSALMLATAAMLANTLTQEVLVRGYVQQTIQSQFGVRAGVIFSALFFLALHLGAIQNQLLPAISLFAAGILLATAYAVSGNLWFPIALHFGWNFLQGPVLGQAVSGQAVDAGWRLFQLDGPALMTGGNFGIEGGLIAIAITILATPFVLMTYPRRRQLA